MICCEFLARAVEFYIDRLGEHEISAFAEWCSERAAEYAPRSSDTFAAICSRRAAAATRHPLGDDAFRRSQAKRAAWGARRTRELTERLWIPQAQAEAAEAFTQLDRLCGLSGGNSLVALFGHLRERSISREAFDSSVAALVRPSDV
jgi:hypothetical protein